ncbi:Fungal specific transcription factor domain-domain containing protein [Rhodotorula toruloides]|uniref:Fungal specific transcription factor domain-domain containing protein n=1 Tax=Rhodotorula toruloides TaxID=5286 RepID=A0A2T0ACR5_RHOTO|nr:Fungal specific transcription factor domain-domain containing protein [Rhodotorula toruloides]
MSEMSASPPEENKPLDSRHDPADLPAKKKPRTTTACNRCRKKRGRCDGQKPICGPCTTAGAVCEYELGADKRKPYTKAVVQAMQLRIDTLEAQLAALTGQPVPSSPGSFFDAQSADPHSILDSSAPLPSDSTSTTPAMTSLSLVANQAVKNGAGTSPTGLGPTSLSFAEGSQPQVSTPNLNGLDTFQGGLAINAHGELRFYGPTSSYRAVLADSTSLLNTPTTVNAIRAFSLTRAPIPTASPADPALPRRPPDLSPDFKVKLLNLAFEYCFSHYNIVPERQFFADLQMYPFERTQYYSPFLMNVILAVGCRYLDPDDPSYPPEICGLIGDPDTRGDVFVTWARYLLDQEWYNPALSTIRGLLVLGLYMAGRGFDGPCVIFVGSALKLTEDFGLNLGPHRLSMSMGLEISEELITARRDCFWSAFASDCISSMYIGRSTTFKPDVIDVIPPPVVPELDFEAPLYRSSAFHWSSRLIFIASKIMDSVYTLRPGISLAMRQAKVPELHLLLESWYHELPSHLRASGADPQKAPHPHILVLNMVYNMMHISLHRPFFRRFSANPTTNVSTEKCLVAASNIVRLVKLLRGSAGLRKAAPGVQHAAFNAGTVLAISAAEDNLSNNPKQDSERRSQAKKDLRLIVTSLKEIGTTWTTAHTSAGVLEALMTQWDASSQPPNQPATNAFAPIQNGSAMPHGSPTSSISSSSTGFPQSFDFSSASPGPSRADLAAQLPKLEQPSYEPSSGPTGSTPMSFASLGLAFPSRPSTAGGHHSLDGVGGGFGTSLGFMFPSWDLGDDVDFGPPPGEQANGNGASTAGLDWGLLNMPECA